MTTLQTVALAVVFTVGCCTILGWLFDAAIAIRGAVLIALARRRWRKINAERARRNPGDRPPQRINCRCVITPQIDDDQEIDNDETPYPPIVLGHAVSRNEWGMVLSAYKNGFLVACGDGELAEVRRLTGLGIFRRKVGMDLSHVDGFVMVTEATKSFLAERERAFRERETR